MSGKEPDEEQTVHLLCRDPLAQGAPDRFGTPGRAASDFFVASSYSNVQNSSTVVINTTPSTRNQVG
jgi:hypothetical protein